MDDTFNTIINDKFKYNIKRSIFIKDMKKYNMEECKIKQKDGHFEIYMKKAGSKKKIKKVYEFKTYNKEKNKSNIKRKIENVEENIVNEIIPEFKKIKLN